MWGLLFWSSFVALLIGYGQIQAVRKGWWWHVFYYSSLIVWIVALFNYVTTEGNG